jgi:hypothetical protein
LNIKNKSDISGLWAPPINPKKVIRKQEKTLKVVTVKGRDLCGG